MTHFDDLSLACARGVPHMAHTMKKKKRKRKKDGFHFLMPNRGYGLRNLGRNFLENCALQGTKKSPEPAFRI